MDIEDLSKNNQKGFVLVLSLILLLIITVASVTNMKTNIIERKMGSDTQDQLLAKQSAESAIQGAKLWLSQQCFKPTTCTCPSTTCTVCAQGTAPTALTSANARTYANGMPLTAAGPVYVIEESYWDAAHGDQYYKITATGFGQSNTTTATLQATYVKHTPFIGYNGAPPGNLFRLRSVSQNLYYIPVCATYLINMMYVFNTNSSSTASNAVWRMCVMDNGTVAFRQHAMTPTAASTLCTSGRYFADYAIGTSYYGIPGPIGIIPQVQSTGNGGLIATSDTDYTTLPTSPNGWFTFLYLYTDSNNTTADGIAEPTVPKTVFLIQSYYNGSFASVYVHTAPNLSWLAAVAPGVPNSNQYYFTVEIVGTAP